MKNGKITMIITIGLICFLLVLIIFMQFKVVYQTDITSIDTMREEDLKAELSSWKTKYEETEDKYIEVTETLKKYQEESSSNGEAKNNLEDELENIEMMLGLTDVEGEGIVITLKDPDTVDYIDYEYDEADAKQTVNYIELIQIINYLKAAGAEAISINGERVVYKTDIAQITVTPSYIKMNSKRISPPYEIKAIGDPDYLKGTLIGTGYVDRIKGWGQTIEFQEQKKITINKYSGVMETKYIEN